MANARLIKYEDKDANIEVSPTPKDVKKAIAIGSYDHSFAQGGFITSSRITYNRDKDEKKALSMLKRIKTRSDIMRMTKAVKSVFGTYSLYPMFVARAKELGSTPAELESIENYSETVDTTQSYKW